MFPLEAKINKHIPIGYEIVPWLMEHTALLLNVESRGQDGSTAWARVRGRPFLQKLLCYAGQGLYKLPSKGLLSQPDGNMGAVQSEGTFVGYSYKANTGRSMRGQQRAGPSRTDGHIRGSRTSK